MKKCIKVRRQLHKKSDDWSLSKKSLWSTFQQRRGTGRNQTVCVFGEGLLCRNRLKRSWKVSAGGHRGHRASELVRRVLGESERLVFDAQQVPHASCTPLLQHEPAGVFPRRLLLRPLLHPLPPEPPGDSRCVQKRLVWRRRWTRVHPSCDSQFEGALAVFAAPQQVAAVLLQLLHLHQPPLPLLLLLLLPLQPQPEGLLWVAGLFLGK